MTTEKIVIVPGKFLPVWLLAGAGVVVSAVTAGALLGQSMKVFTETEWFYLLQGGWFVLAAVLVLSRAGFSFRELLRDADAHIAADFKQALKYLLICAVVAGALLAVVSLAVYALMQAHQVSVEGFNRTVVPPEALAVTHGYIREVLAKSPFKLAIYLFSTCVLVPVEEEIFFRRFIYVWLRNKMPFISALLISAAVFGAAHLSGIIAALPVGILLGWVYEKKGRLAVPIIIHGLLNLVVAVLTLAV
jgi:membrane protease YdiL (CAAX protease family)